MKVVGVTLKKDGDIVWCDAGNFNLKKNITVIFSKGRETYFGTVICLAEDNSLDDDINVAKILRISSKKDYLKHLTNIKDASKAILICKKVVLKYDLPMSIIDATYTFDRSQLLFRFVADSRVDFRLLARELGAIFKTRIELRQIGIRDKAKEIGGFGPCGRILCCHSFLTNFDSVSINMAKNQSLSLNPSKINGVCGRLLCCLNYENDNYSFYRQGIPEIGSFVVTSKGKGKVISVDIFRKKYRVFVEKFGVLELEVNDDC